MNRFMLLLLLVLSILFLSVPVMGQGAEVTPEPTPVVIEDSTPDDNIAIHVWQIVGGLLTAFAAGGIVGIAGAGTLASRIRNDEATMKAIEGLANSAPEHVVQILHDLSKSLIEIGRLGKEATDGVPATLDTTLEPLAAGGQASPPQGEYRLNPTTNEPQWMDVSTPSKPPSNTSDDSAMG